MALDIQHGGYDGSYLPWSTGISVRDSINMLQLYAGKDGGVGFFLEAYDINNHKVISMDKNGYASFSGLSIKKGYTPDKSSSCEKGAIMSDDDYLYVCTSAGRFKKVALSSL